MISLSDLFYITLSVIAVVSLIAVWRMSKAKKASATEPVVKTSSLPSVLVVAKNAITPLAKGDIVQRVSKGGKVRGEGPVLEVINGGKTVVVGSSVTPGRVYKRSPNRFRRVAMA